MRNAYWSLAGALLLILTACGHGNQDALNVAGIQAQRIERLWWLLFWVSLVMFVVVMAFLGGRFSRSHGAELLAERAAPEEEASERGRRSDVSPGDNTAIWFQVDCAGVCRGQCAEFWGHQQAHMAFLVIADLPANFQQWLQHQGNSAAPPMESAAKRGQEVFLSSTCVMCHTIRGTSAGSKNGPDLTHIASRGTIAAGTIPNTPGYLAGWIADSQHIKPGNHMPPNTLPSDDLQALLAYLEGLQ